MLEFFSSRFMHYNLDMQLVQGGHNMCCDIHIFSATTATVEALHFSIPELIIVECSGHVQEKFSVVFFVQRKFCVAFSREKEILRVFSLYNMCNNFFRSSVSAAKTSVKVLSIETKVLYILVKSKPN